VMDATCAWSGTLAVRLLHISARCAKRWFHELQVRTIAIRACRTSASRLKRTCSPHHPGIEGADFSTLSRNLPSTRAPSRISRLAGEIHRLAHDILTLRILAPRTVDRANARL
jgi:hypothetical protein